MLRLHDISSNIIVNEKNICHYHKDYIKNIYDLINNINNSKNDIISNNIDLKYLRYYIKCIDENIKKSYYNLNKCKNYEDYNILHNIKKEFIGTVNKLLIIKEFLVNKINQNNNIRIKNRIYNNNNINNNSNNDINNNSNNDINNNSNNNNKNNIVKENECSICMSEYNNSNLKKKVIGKCLHIVCKSCYDRIVHTNPVCPFCRTKI